MSELKLKTPINAHGEVVDSLTFRDPTGADLVACGVPFTISMNGGGAGRIEPDMKAMATWISKLASIPPSSVATLSFVDMAAASAKVSGFFMAAIPELFSTTSSASDIGGETLPTS